MLSELIDGEGKRHEPESKFLRGRFSSYDVYFIRLR
jgi:hypothetical protein